jgi:phytoene dehydrogenase-like protein
VVGALAERARSSGGEIRTGVTVRSLKDLPPSRAVLFDVTPRQLLAIAGESFSPSYGRRLAGFRYGTAVFKIDYALSATIPWRSPACAQAATIHVGGSYEEIARSEADVGRGRVADAPFVLVAQQSQFDDTRAPGHGQTAWAYCHVPHACTIDMTDRIERQIERFAPGFRDTILARHALTPAALESHNANLVGGDIAGGSNALDQFLFRPFPRWNPYTTSHPRLFVCSSSTPPGGGVHGMCGYWAARTVLRRVFRAQVPKALEL